MVLCFYMKVGNFQLALLGNFQLVLTSVPGTLSIPAVRQQKKIVKETGVKIPI